MFTTAFQEPKPLLFTLFGASGDLAQLKIFPALFELALKDQWHPESYIIGYARSGMSEEAFRERFAESVKKKTTPWGEREQTVLDALLPRVHYVQGPYDDVAGLTQLGEKVASFSDKAKEMTHIAYYSIPPQVFGPLTQAIADAPNLPQEQLRLVIEKPFGTDEASARKLFHHIGQYFEEDQVYLLDHYLGKHAVRSILTLRHHNRLLNSMLKGPSVDSIQIHALESVGVEERLGYFDQVGTLKDMLQSHLLQMLALTTMSIPVDWSAESIRREKAAILSALSFTPHPAHVSVGQYAGYCDSQAQVCSPYTPTFGALRLSINRESWYQVPVYIRSGKYLPRKETSIAVTLKKFAFQPEDFPANQMLMELAPHERLHLKLYDETGHMTLPTESTGVHSLSCHQDMRLSEHGRLLLDVLREDQTFFLSFEEIIASWRVMDQVIGFLGRTKPEVYARGSTGPRSQYRILPEWTSIEAPEA